MLFKIWNMSMDDIINITVYLLNAELWVRPKAQLEMHIRNGHIRSVNFCVTMIVFNQDLPRNV